MATDMNKLQGEIEANPVVPAIHDKNDIGVERLIAGFLRTLLEEQRPAAEMLPNPNATPAYLTTKQALESVV